MKHIFNLIFIISFHFLYAQDSLQYCYHVLDSLTNEKNVQVQKIEKNNVFLMHKTDSLNRYSATFSEDKDLTIRFEISKQKAFFKDSITLVNSAFENHINALDKELIFWNNRIFSLKNSVETKADEKRVILTKAEIAAKNKEKEKRAKEKEKEKAKKLALKAKREKEKAKRKALKAKEKAKKKKTEINDNNAITIQDVKNEKSDLLKEDSIVQLENIIQSDSIITIISLKDSVVKSSSIDSSFIYEKRDTTVFVDSLIKKESDSVENSLVDTNVNQNNNFGVDKLISNAANLIQGTLLVIEDKTVENQVELVEQKTDSNHLIVNAINDSIVQNIVDTTQFNAQTAEGLIKQKITNDLFLSNKLREIDALKSMLNVDEDIQEVLNLAKLKFFVTDSILSVNKKIQEQLAQFELKSYSKDSMQVPIQNDFVFDLATNIDSTKWNQDNKVAFETEQNLAINNQQILPKDTSVIKTIEIDEVKKTATNKKVKYVLGDKVDKGSEEKAKFYLARAKKEIDASNMNKALEYINISISLNPSYADAYMLKGDLYSSITYFEKAVNAYQKASFLNPENAQLHYNIGNCFIRLGNDELAIQEWTKAIENDSKYILAYAGRASLLMKQNDFKQALNDYNKIFEINKYFYVAYKGRGVAYLELGEWGKAIIDFNNYLEFEPKDDFVFLKRGLAKLYDNEIYGACMDMLTAVELGNNEAEKYLKKYCEK